MKPLYLFITFFVSILFYYPADAQNPAQTRITREGKGKVNPRVDNMGYWKEMVRKGYVLPDPYTRIPEAHYTSSIVEGDEIRRQNSPDIPTSGEVNTTQSENSVFLNPANDDEIFNSNNSTTWNGLIVGQLFGADHLFSDDGGASWGGSIQNAGDYNSGDPAVVIGLNGRQYVGKINVDYGQSVAWSDNKGQTWNEVQVAGVPSPGMDILDKNHLCIDNSTSSPYEGNLYCAWTTFINNQNGKIEISRSVDEGLTWFPPFEISQGANAVANNQGVNLQTGPNGQVYATWAVYDDPGNDEVALGFARSLNGGSVFLPATRIINNIRGIRATGVSKNMRVNSFPSMAVDNSGGSYDGAVYIVWTNIGQP
ncbi:MAG: sialidase family protein, partial [Syntrophothermus sp.]